MLILWVTSIIHGISMNAFLPLRKGLYDPKAFIIHAASLDQGFPHCPIFPFAPHAFEPQRQYWSSWPPSPLVFFPISTQSTATPEIPPTSTILKNHSHKGKFQVEPGDLTSVL